ncbi:MAG TPA: ABC transporter permease, partial [Acidobacteriota bacterium]
EILLAARVSQNFFRLFGETPVAGRDFLPEEDRIDGAPVVMISEALWKDRFGREKIIGKQIRLNDSLFTVVGIVPNSFRLPSEFVDRDIRCELWLPVTPTAHNRGRGIRRFEAYARLGPQTSIDAARAKIQTIAKSLERAYPDTNRKIDANIVSLHEVIIHRSRSILYILLGAVILVLLIGCANAANLMFGRGTSRMNEIAIRKALGASWIRIAQQLVAESVLLSLAAGILGLLIGIWGTELFVAMYPGGIPRLYEAGINLPVFGFNLVISLLTGFLFGLAPAWQSARRNLAETMKGASRIDLPSQEKITGKMLAVLEISMAVALAIGAGLLIRSFNRLIGTHPGITTKDLLTMKIVLPADKYADP